MERCDRPETSQRSEISELQHDSTEMSSGSQARHRERAEAESVQVPRRVVINWERLVGAKVRPTQSTQTEIEAAMELAYEIQYSEDLSDLYAVFFCRRFLLEYALRLVDLVSPLDQGRGVLQFKLASRVVILQKNMMPLLCCGAHYIRTIHMYCSWVKEEWGIENLEAEEQAAREGRAPEGEDPSYQVWRTKRLTRFDNLSNIFTNAAKFLAERMELEVCSNAIFDPLDPKPQDFHYLHQQLFPTNVESVPSSEQQRMEYSRSAAELSKLHDETLARDLEQFLDHTLSWRFMFSRLWKQVFGLVDGDTVMMVHKLCMEKVEATTSFLDSRKGGWMNMNQCILLGGRLRKVWSFDIFRFPNAHLLGELLQLFHDTHMLIKANCNTTSKWPRVAFEQGDMHLAFSKVFHDLKWHVSLISRMDFACFLYNGVLSEAEVKNGGQLGEKAEYDLLRAVKKDEENMKHLLRSRKAANPIGQRLAHQLLQRMEASSSSLVFLNLNGFDHKGAPLIGSGAFGAVVKYNFLGMECAMKVIEGTSVDLEFEKEMNAIKELGNHPNLVRLYCYSKTTDACYLIMEKLQMDLAKVIRLKDKNGNRLTMVEVVALMLQIGEGLKHIHGKGAAHRDLKPGNILVNLTDPSCKYLSRIQTVKIADFGISKTQAAITGSNHTKNKGSSAYMAPEVMKLGEEDLESTRFNPAKADVYSFGVVCSEILSGEIPYGGRMSKLIKEQVKAGTLRPNLPLDCPFRLTTLIKRCWHGDYNERPLLHEVCRELRYIKGLLLMFMDRYSEIGKQVFK